MSEIITIQPEQALQQNNLLFVDTRSPSEYVKGHIPGAYNLPILEDDERCIVGTLYKKEGPEEARRAGLEIVSGKLPKIVNTIQSLQNTGTEIVIYCWRGGMRSRSIVTVLQLMGVNARQLLGGYKAYRKYIQDSLATMDIRPQIIVLCGSTGVGKTTILNSLEKRGYPVLDLEALANHRGSAFGQVGLGESATAQNFDSHLWTFLRQFNNSPFLIVECESKRIGNVYLPDILHDRIKNGTRILLKASLENRVTRLIIEYTTAMETVSDEIRHSIISLQRKLGKRKTSEMLTLFNDGQLPDLVRMLLIDYYDPLYGYEQGNDDKYAAVIDANDINDAINQIEIYLGNLTKGE
jgi:tRNA 2-selenouridine synthase